MSAAKAYLLGFSRALVRMRRGALSTPSLQHGLSRSRFSALPLSISNILQTYRPFPKIGLQAVRAAILIVQRLGTFLSNKTASLYGMVGHKTQYHTQRNGSLHRLSYLLSSLSPSGVTCLIKGV
jgi:hypothetical protein